MKNFTAPLILAFIGAAWLLAELKIVDIKQYIWTIALFAVGLSIFFNRGFCKESFVPGFFFTIWGAVILLIDLDVISNRIHIPLMLLILGILMTFARTSLIPDAQKKNEVTGN
jgi:hypothetical protein